eukprot:15238696-Ditylum_brightwellii.AAC.1
MAIICAHHGTSAPALIAHSLASHRSLKNYGATQQKQCLKEYTTLTGTSYNVIGLKHIYKLERISHHIANNDINFVCIQ